jgi:hypothetical protein
MLLSLVYFFVGRILGPWPRPDEGTEIELLLLRVVGQFERDRLLTPWDASAMPKRPRDVNSLAKQIVDEAMGEAEHQNLPSRKEEAAIKRGNARSASLPAARRAEIARKAARARWAKRSES